MQGPRAIRIGDRRFLPQSRELQSGEHTTRLDPRESQVLEHLAAAAPEVVDTATLLARNWVGMVVTDNALHRVIARLRRAFGDRHQAPRFIETIARRGYRLVAPVEIACQPPSARVAILPLHPITADAMTLAVAAGIGAELRGALQRSGVVGVMLDASPPPTLTDDELQAVNHLLSGSVRVHGQRLRAQLELVDARRGELVWTRAWDRRLDDVISAEIEVAESVERAIVPLLEAARPA